jgi:TRAP-type transport system small permease protein
MTAESSYTPGGIERLVGRINNGLRTISMTLLFFMMLFVAADIIGRFFFNKPFKGSTDLIELMMGVVVFSGIAYCAQKDGHARVDVLYNHFPQRFQALLDILTFGASLFVYALIAWKLFARAWAFLVNPAMGPSTDTLHIPHVYFILFAGLGSFVLCLQLLIHIMRSAARVRKGGAR